jgi:hypothetical protein
MGKPFKVAEQQAPRDGRRNLNQMKSLSPPQVVQKAKDTGTSADKMSEEESVPDHPVPDGVKDSEKPWPKAGPINDTNTKPMRMQ